MPALDVLLVALVALLIVYAWPSWTVKALESWKAQSPGLFGPLFDALISADATVYNALRKWTDPAVQPFSATLQAVIAAAEALTVNPLAFARAVYAALTQLSTVSIPNAITNAEATARSLFDQAEGAAQSLFQAAQQAIASGAADLASLRQHVEELSSGLLARLSSGLQGAFDYALAQAQEALAQASALLSQEVGRAQAAEQDLVNRIDAVAVAAAQDVARAETEVVNRIDAAAVAVAQEAAQGRADLEKAFTLEAQDIAARIDAVLASGPWGALAAAYAGGEAALKAEVAELVSLSLAELRRQIADTESLRARYGPVLAQLIPQAKA